MEAGVGGGWGGDSGIFISMGRWRIPQIKSPQIKNPPGIHFGEKIKVPQRTPRQKAQQTKESK